MAVVGVWFSGGLAFVIVVLASVVKGVLGFGFPLIAVPTLASVVGARAAVVAMTIPSLAGNFLVMADVGARRLQRWYVILIASLVLGSVAGALLLNRLPVKALALGLGLATLGLLALIGRQVGGSGDRLRPWAPLAGLLAGILGGATDVPGPVLVAYLAGVEHDQDRFVFSMTLLFIISGGAQMLTFARSRVYTPHLVLAGLVACIPMAAGTWAGIRWRARLRSETFRRAVLVVVALSALNLVRQGLWG